MRPTVTSTVEGNDDAPVHRLDSSAGGYAGSQTNQIATTQKLELKLGRRRKFPEAAPSPVATPDARTQALLEKLAKDPGSFTLGELLQQREAAYQEIVRLRHELSGTMPPERMAVHIPEMPDHPAVRSAGSVLAPGALLTDAELHHGLEGAWLLRVSTQGADVYMRVYMKRSRHAVPNRTSASGAGEQLVCIRPPAGVYPPSSWCVSDSAWCVYGVGW